MDGGVPTRSHKSRRLSDEGTTARTTVLAIILHTDATICASEDITQWVDRADISGPAKSVPCSFCADAAALALAGACKYHTTFGAIILRQTD